MILEDILQVPVFQERQSGHLVAHHRCQSRGRRLAHISLSFITSHPLKAQKTYLSNSQARVTVYWAVEYGASLL